MSEQTKTKVTVQATVNAPIETVWAKWTTPLDIMQWNSASPDWHTPRAENDLRAGGKFLSRMEAKDGSFGFDFEGIYDTVKPKELIEYSLGDSRQVSVAFSADGNTTKVVESFDPETVNPVEMQQAGWQAILDNFKKYTEGSL